MRKMESYKEYIGHDLCKVPLSNIAQRIMSAMQSVPLEEAQNSREGGQNVPLRTNSYTSAECLCQIRRRTRRSKEVMFLKVLQSTDPADSEKSVEEDRNNEKMNEYKFREKKITLENEEEMHDSIAASLNMNTSTAKNNSQLASTELMDKMFCNQNTKIVSSVLLTSNMSTFINYQDVDLTKWDNKERNSSVQRKKNRDSENNNITSLKRKQDISTYCSYKMERWLPVKKDVNSHKTKYDWASEQAESPEKTFCDIRNLGYEEKSQLITTIKEAVALVVTMVFQDGSSQLSSDQGLVSSVRGIVVLIKKQTDQLCPSKGSSIVNPIVWDACTRNDKCIYLKIEHSSVWEQQEQTHKKYIREILFQILHCTIICFNAKDFLRTLLHVYGDDINWKQVADCVVLDPRIAAWLINPSDTVPSFEYLIHKYFENPVSERTVNMNADSLRNTLHQNLVLNLKILYSIMMELCSALQVQGLWKLFCTLELPLIKILAVMETHKIHVNKEELKRTSEILGLRLKELEQEAHRAAGQQFLLTSSSQLREVLFEKLKLHMLCEKVPRTEMQHLQSTSEVVLNKLQDLHPLPKIILEYRQVHKIKSTYVDGLLSCMKKGFISSTWNQTGTVTGRLSAKHPNIQGISKHPVQIIKKQYVKGKENEIVTISPRTLFVSAKGYTFLAADFSHIELRILAHLSCDPELLKLFQEPETTDVFTTLASQWRGIPSEQVKHADREQAKRVVYSVVYGAGKERLAGCLGITPLQAGQFIESFLMKYKKIHDFTKKTIEQCHNEGYVVSIMGRRRHLPNINARDYRLRTQAERQAVNFVVQGSAADLCKMAMVEIFTSVAISPTLTARLISAPTGADAVVLFAIFADRRLDVDIIIQIQLIPVKVYFAFISRCQFISEN
ncbi:DNA polymerase nu [Malaclemys terrapin pileata]|uniref:DNA polymerase nu n=1 Tax=Malaclemys terrapin pileata TaxID=2991368 RepID=UPI0023A8154B|nr:DNA polymerase nu [Malaclemys terrapin pileata]